MYVKYYFKLLYEIFGYYVYQTFLKEEKILVLKMMACMIFKMGQLVKIYTVDKKIPGKKTHEIKKAKYYFVKLHFWQF